MKNETATSSKLAVKELLGDAGADGTVGTQIKAVGTAINEMKTIIDAAATNAQPTGLDISAKFTALSGAVTAANKAIDEKLDSGDLTQLDTSNLKALKSSINDIKSQIETTFDDLGLSLKGANNPTVPQAKAKELLEAFKAVETSNTELGGKAKGVATSSQNQAETVVDMHNNAESIVHRHKTIPTVTFTVR